MSLPELLTGLAASLLATSAEAQTADCRTAVVNTNLVTMHADAVLREQTILFGETAIIAFGPAGQMDESRCETVVDGTDRYVLPGLNDLHVHTNSMAFARAFGRIPTDLPFDALLEPYIFHGVTGVRVMSGSADLITYRDRGSLLPVFVVASPMLAADESIVPQPLSHVVTDADDARAAVAAFAEAGYDLIKIRRNLPPEVLQAVIREARSHGLDVHGHVTRTGDLSVLDIAGMGQSGFAHLDELLRPLRHGVSLDALAGALNDCECYVSTAIGVSHTAAAQIRDFETARAAAPAAYVSRSLRTVFWSRDFNPYLNSGQEAGFFDALLADVQSLAAELDARGVTLVAGSDALIPTIAPGIGLHDELDLLIAGGLTRFNALRMATANARAVPGFERVGLLEPGAMPSAVIVAGNPLEDHHVLREPDQVIVRGVAASRAELELRLEAALRIIEQH